jgi:hypothetical protein
MINEKSYLDNEHDSNLIVTQKAINSINKTAEPIDLKEYFYSQDYLENERLALEYLKLSLVVPSDEINLNERCLNSFWAKVGHGHFVRCFLMTNGKLTIYDSIKFDPANPTIESSDLGSEFRIITNFITNDGFKWLTKETFKKDTKGGFFGTADLNAIKPTKVDAIESNIIVLEVDLHTLDYQLENNLKPLERIADFDGSIIFSGGKSLHYHLHVDEKLSPDQILKYRMLLNILFSGDNAMCTTLSQPFRFPYLFRADKGNFQSVLKLGKLHTTEQLDKGFETIFNHYGLPLPNLENEALFEALKLFNKRTQRKTKGKTANNLELYHYLITPLLEHGLSKQEQKRYNRLKKHRENATFTPLDYSKFDDLENTVVRLLDAIPSCIDETGRKIDNTYQDYLPLATAVRNILGLEKGCELIPNHRTIARFSQSEIRNFNRPELGLRVLFSRAKKHGYNYTTADLKYLRKEKIKTAKTPDIDILKITPAITKKTNFIGTDMAESINIAIDQGYGGVDIKAIMGAGKTLSLTGYRDTKTNEFIYGFLTEKNNILLIGNRQNLTGGLADQLGLEKVFGGLEFDQRSKSGFAVVLDSLLRLTPLELKPTYILIDEVEQVVSTLYNGGTGNLKKNRPAILNEFTRLISQPNVFLICMDANASDYTKHQLELLSGKKLLGIEYLPVDLLEIPITELLGEDANKRETIASEIKTQISQNKKVVISCDTKGHTEYWLKYFSDLYGTTKRILMINGDNSIIHNTENKATVSKHKGFASWLPNYPFLDNPSQYLIDSKADIVIYNSIVQSGVSFVLPEGYFSSHYILSNRLLEPRDLSQMTMRLRDRTCPRYLAYFRSVPNGYQCREDILKRHQCFTSDFALDFEQNQGNIEDFEARHLALIDFLNNQFETHKKHHDFSVQLEDNLNHLYFNYEANLEYLLEKEGFIFQQSIDCDLDVDEDNLKARKANYKKSKLEIATKNARDIVYAETITVFEANDLDKVNLLPNDKNSVKKAYLKEKLPVLFDVGLDTTLNFLINDPHGKKFDSFFNYIIAKKREIYRHLLENSLNSVSKTLANENIFNFEQCRRMTEIVTIFKEFKLKSYCTFKEVSSNVKDEKLKLLAELIRKNESRFRAVWSDFSVKYLKTDKAICNQLLCRYSFKLIKQPKLNKHHINIYQPQADLAIVKEGREVSLARLNELITGYKQYILLGLIGIRHLTFNQGFTSEYMNKIKDNFSRHKLAIAKTFDLDFKGKNLYECLELLLVKKGIFFENTNNNSWILRKREDEVKTVTHQAVSEKIVTAADTSEKNNFLNKKNSEIKVCEHPPKPDAVTADSTFELQKKIWKIPINKIFFILKNVEIDYLDQNGTNSKGKVREKNQFEFEIIDSETQKILPCDMRKISLAKRLIDGVEISISGGLAWLRGGAYCNCVNLTAR